MSSGSHGDRHYDLASVGEYFVTHSRNSSRTASLSNSLTPPSSGDHGGIWSLGSENLDCFKERWHLLLDFLRPEDRRAVSQVSIRMWREVCIWHAMEGAFAGRHFDELEYNEVITERMIQMMLEERPTPNRGPRRYFTDMRNVPKEYTGHFCIRDEETGDEKWYHES